MKPSLPTVLTIVSKFSVLVALVIVLIPTPSFGQRPAGGQRGGMQMGGLGQGMMEILDQLDLTPEQKEKTNAILKQTSADVREAMQGAQQLDPQERRAKMQEVQKMMLDGKDKIEAELTPEQKKKFYPLNAKLLLKRAIDMLGAIKTGSAKMEIDDEVRKQLAAILDDTEKTFDGYKKDADAVNSPTSETDFQQKLTKTQMDLNKQLRDVLGQEDAQQLMQSARQAGMGGGGRQIRRQPNSAGKPATQP